MLGAFREALAAKLREAESMQECSTLPSQRRRWDHWRTRGETLKDIIDALDEATR